MIKTVFPDPPGHIRPRSVNARILNGILVALLAAGIALGGYYLLRLYTGVNDAIYILRQAREENNSWTVAQAQVDLQAYLIALHHAKYNPDPATLEEVSHRFDILYSRVMTIEAAVHNSNVLGDPQLEAQWNKVVATVTGDAATFDLGVAAIRQNLDRLHDEATATVELVRAFSTQALQQIVTDAFTRREDMRTLFERFTATASVMLALLVMMTIGLIVTLLNLVRRSRDRNQLSMRLEKVIDASMSAIVIADAQGRVQNFNAAAERLFQLSPVNLMNRTMNDLFVEGSFGHGLIRAAHNQQQAFQTLLGDALQVRSLVYRPDGSQVPVETSFAVDSDLDGAPIWIVFFNDISQQVAFEGSLEKARDAAVRGEQAKSRFLAVMSHEMRTPLNGLIAALEILDHTTRPTVKQAEFLTIARRCANMALEQIDDVLELTRLDRDTSSDEIEDFDLLALMESLAVQFRPLAERRGNDIYLALPGRGPLWLRAQRRMIGRVVLNLLGNAVKFTSHGSIGLTVEVEAGPAGRQTLRVKVSDTGIGIPASKLDLIFRDFETAHPDYKGSEGTGLGLSIVRRAVLRMGGSVSVDSVEGKGSTFTVTLPVELGTPQIPVQPRLAAQAQDGAVRPAQRVLIAEDNAINRHVLKEMLARFDCRVDEAPDGREAVRLASAQRYDLIFMDMSMPELDGLAATAEIRAKGESQGSRIVGLTAHVQAETLDQMRKLMDDVLLKPVTFAHLERALGSAATVPPQDQTPEAAPAEPAPASAPVEKPKPAKPRAPRKTPPPPRALDVQAMRDLAESFAPADLAELVARFIQDTDDHLSILMASASPEDAAKTAHRIAGSGALFGTKELSRLMVQLETDCRLGEAEALARKAPEIRSCWSETRDELQELVTRIAA